MMFYTPIALAGALLLAAIPSTTAYSLGTCSGRAVHGAASVSNSGLTTVNGDLSVSPAAGSTVTGFGTGAGVITGTFYSPPDTEASDCEGDIATLYNDLVAETTGVTPVTDELDGSTLLANVYAFATTAKLSNGGTLTLDGNGVSTGKWVFKIGSALSTTVGSSIVLTNGAQACNVYFQVGSSAVIADGTSFQGNIVASQSISVGNGATVNGNLLAKVASVSLIANSITACT
ncbi:hypothetical protein EDC01DRAFT_786194 [Geopyxis carbonaria]|nr:hypothetical protein EDC01DRAFT_786194 [Geopyxis carbonaria]